MRAQKTEDIKKALEEVIDARPGESTEETLEKILRALDSKKVLRYHRDSDIGLLSTPGRVLIAIIEDPTMTIRAISVYLDLSETMIDKTVKQLINAGLITKTKVNRQHIYRVNQNLVLEQPDIRHFANAIESMYSTQEKNEDEVVEQEPF
jgi:predicted transcriptional regulator